LGERHGSPGSPALESPHRLLWGPCQHGDLEDDASAPIKHGILWMLVACWEQWHISRITESVRVIWFWSIVLGQHSFQDSFVVADQNWKVDQHSFQTVAKLENQVIKCN
jgi:hypothetical protein